MSQIQTKPAPIFLDHRVSEASREFLAIGGTSREKAMLMEANQRLLELYDQIEQVDITSEPIIAIIDGEEYSFENTEEMAKWIRP